MRGVVRRGSTFAAILGLLLLMLIAGTPPVASGTLATPQSHASGGISGTVLWGGTDISAASSPASAFSIGYSNHVDVRFYWNATNPSTSYSIRTARIEMVYFGSALSITDSAPNGSHAAELTWDGAGALRWFLSGTYGVTASLVSVNGSTAWSERFFVHVMAPYTVLAAVPILLLILLALELIAVARSGAEPAATPKGLAPQAPPAASPASEPPANSSTESVEPPKEE